MKTTVSHCPIEGAMRVLSGRWPTLLLYYLKEGTKRFSDLRRDNPTVSHRILSLELRKLEAAGIVRRTAYGGYPLRVEYTLTPFGQELVPLIDAIGAWWRRAHSRAAANESSRRKAARSCNLPLDRRQALDDARVGVLNKPRVARPSR